MKIVQEHILFDCLEQFEAGVSVEALKAKYPHAAAEIEKFLAVTAHLQQVRLQPSLAAKQQSQKLFLQQAAQLRTAKRQNWFSWRTLQQTLLPLASLAMVTLLLSVTFLFASASAMPGDLLYDTKRWVESWQLEQQASDATAVFNLNAQQNEERLREVKSLLRAEEVAEVSFEGRINTKQGNNWIIAGISVHVTGQTQVDFGAETGALVVVNGRSQNGHLYASQISVLQQAAATATPLPSATASQTPQPTATGTSTATAMPSATSTTTQTATVTATAEVTGTPMAATPTPTTTLTATPKASATPAATQTATAVPTQPTSTAQPTSVPTAVDDNSNDNGNANDGGNENDNSGSSGNDNSGNDNDNDNDDNDNNGGNSGSGGGDDNDNSNDDNDNDNDNRDRDD